MALNEKDLTVMVKRLQTLGIGTVAGLVGREMTKLIVNTVCDTIEELRLPKGDRYRMECERCGSEDVLRDAFAEWDKVHQVWTLRATYDHAVCESETCDGNETHIKSVLIEPTEEDKAD